MLERLAVKVRNQGFRKKGLSKPKVQTAFLRKMPQLGSALEKVLHLARVSQTEI